MTKLIPQPIPTEGDVMKKKGKRSSKEDATVTLPILPQDVIFFNIFIRLPAHLLILLRSISRSSLEVIDNSRFALRHAVYFSSPCLIFFAFNRFHHFQLQLLALQISRGLHSRNRIISLQYVRLGIPYANTILASCNGLLLLCTAGPIAQGIAIANPVRKKWRMLPSSLDGPFGQNWQCLYGFVFDALSNQYKVVRLLLDQSRSLLCEVLNFGSLSEGWRLVNVPVPTRPGAVINADYRPVSIGQILYWVDGHSREWHGTTVFNPSEHHIMSMDVSKEEFRRMEPPTDVNGLCSILELGGQLALLNFDNIMADIWVLQDYERQTWVKKISTMNKSLVKFFGYRGYRIRFEISASIHGGKVIVFKSRNRLFKYDVEHDCFEEVKTHCRFLGMNPSYAIISNPCVHADSLVWP